MFFGVKVVKCKHPYNKKSKKSFLVCLSVNITESWVAYCHFSGVASGSRAAGRSALASMRECSFYARHVRKTDNLEKTNRTTSHTRPARPARPACFARPAHDTPDIHALPALSPVARASRITRPAACGVHCMPSYALCPQPGTENTKYAEKRHEVAKCQRFGAVNRP